MSQSLRTQVTAVSSQGNILAWDQLDQALPLPFDFEDPLMNFVLAISDLASCNQEILKVADLQSGQYTLTVDKMNVGRFPPVSELMESISH